MNATKYALTAAATAAGMYWFDPAQGRRRRALLRDKLVSLGAQARHAAGVTGRDMRHRLQGAAARAGSMIRSADAADEVIVERVRAALGRATSHPATIEVSCSQGAVILKGPVLKQEHARVVRAARSATGVSEVRDELTVYKRRNGVSALQGSRSLPKQSFPGLQENWSPTARLLAGATGASLAVWGLRQSPLVAVLAAATGGALIVRGASNAPLKRLIGGTGRRAVDIQKTIHIAAPVEQVFETLAHYQNFPFFMRNVRRVSMHPDGRSHWVVAGPGGASVEWDAETTLCRPNEVLAWRTVRNSTVDHAGIMRLQPENGGTRLDVHLTYSPPAGALGHAVAKIFGADAKTELAQDLLRLKTYLETGVRAHDAAIPRSETQIPPADMSEARPAL
jgi:uncharacterized membrane protein